MRRHAGIAILCASLLWAQDAYACQPCARMLDMQQTISKASLIIVGTRTTPEQPGEKRQEGGPEHVDIEVESVLKGEGSSALRATAWFSMCPYGIVTPVGKPYVMFLEKSKSGIYNAVNQGCAITTLKIEDGQVVTQDGLVSMEKFRQLIK